MSLLYKIGAVLIIFALIFCSGYYLGSRDVGPKVLYKDKIISNTVYRDYPNMGLDECLGIASAYDKGVFDLDIHHVMGDQYKLTGSLYQRHAERDVYIGSAGNWKLYAGTGIIGIAVGAYAYHKLR